MIQDEELRKLVVLLAEHLTLNKPVAAFLVLQKIEERLIAKGQ